jgi:hypothetical protein
LAVARDKLVGDARWHHVAVVLDPMESDIPRVSDIRLYIDGQRQRLNDLIEGGIATGCAEPFRIGSSHDAENPGWFGGLIDEVQVFDIALSAESIAQVYAETRI